MAISDRQTWLNREYSSQPSHIHSTITLNLGQTCAPYAQNFHKELKFSKSKKKKVKKTRKTSTMLSIENYFALSLNIPWKSSTSGDCFLSGWLLYVHMLKSRGEDWTSSMTWSMVKCRSDPMYIYQITPHSISKYLSFPHSRNHITIRQ